MNAVVSFLGGLHPSLGSLYGAPLYIFLAVIVMTLMFAGGYAFKGTQVIWQLRAAIKGVSLQQKEGKAPKATSLSPYFVTEPLRHLWEEYSDTLHEMKRASSGPLSLIEVRATVPAETLFTREVLVDNRLFDDFTKHLPGVLTGLGIIGTFAGLLEGLSKFDPTSTEKAVTGLGPLLQGVSHAFVASATAIGCAMIVVFASRLVLAYCYRLVERLAHGIDSLYSTGAGEEYLARLVKSSEQSEANTAQLKDALVEDMRKMMTELVERQMAANQTATHELGTHLGNTISGVMAKPISTLTDAINATSQNNGERVSGMLETLLTGFMAKLEDTFGGQMRGINEQMQNSMQAMTAVQASLQELLADIQKTNEQSTKLMSGAFEDALKQTADNQQVLTNQMREFVQDFKKLIADERDNSQQALNEAMSKVLSDLSAAVQHMERIRVGAAAEENKRHDDMSGALKDALKQAADNQQVLMDQMREFVQDFKKLIAEERNQSQQALNEAMSKVLSDLSAAVQHMERIRVGAAAEENKRHDDMSGALEDALKKAADNQQVLIDQMREFVQDFKKLIAEERNQSQQALSEAMSKVLSDLSAAVQHMEKIRVGAATEEGKRHDDLAKGTTALVGGLSTQVDELLKAVSEQVTKTQQNIDAIGNVSTRAIDGMNQGALTMASAADRFQSAGNTVTNVVEKAGQLSQSLTQSASALQVSAQAVQKGLEQYDNTRKAVDTQVLHLMGLLESAKKEAGVSKELVESIRISAATLQTAEAQSREHLEQVNAALLKAFNDFGSALVEQVRKSVKETDAHMANGMGQLSGVVQGLVQAVQRMTKA